MYIMSAFRPGLSRPGRTTMIVESSAKAVRSSGSRAMISILFGTKPITASAIANTVSNSFALSRLAGAIRVFVFTFVWPFSATNDLLLTAFPRLLVPDILGRSVKVQRRNLQFPFHRYGRRRIANPLVASLILQLTRNGNRLCRPEHGSDAGSCFRDR